LSYHPRGGRGGARTDDVRPVRGVLHHAGPAILREDVAAREDEEVVALPDRLRPPGVIYNSVSEQLVSWAGLLAQGGRAVTSIKDPMGRPVCLPALKAPCTPLATLSLTIETHFPLHLRAIWWQLPNDGPPGQLGVTYITSQPGVITQ
jgi:hypothetical protein